MSIKTLEFYENNNQIDSTKIGLKRISNIKATTDHKIVNTYDSIILSKNNKNLKYKGYNILIDKITDQGVELDLPVKLYSNLLTNRAKTTNHKIISPNNTSSFPIWGFPPDDQDLVKDLIKLINELSKNTSSDISLQKLDQTITNEMFDAAKKIAHYNEVILPKLKDILEGENDNISIFETIEILERFIKNNAAYISVTKQRLSLEYPYPIKDFIFYISDSTEIFNQELLLPVKNDSELKYKIYLDKSKNQYGIIDELGNIIIDATYTSLKPTTNEKYYFNPSDSMEYFLNVDTKKLEPLKKGYKFENKFGNLTILRNNKYKLGSIENDKKIIPFQYNQIYAYNKFIIAEYAVRGRPIIDIYSKEGKLYKTSEIIRQTIETENGDLIIRNNEHKYGLLNDKGEIVIPLQYNSIETTPIKDYLLVRKNNKNFLLKNHSKTINYPTEARSITSNLIGEGIFGYLDEKSYFYGYFDENENIVIPPKYYYITRFINDRALVETANRDLMIIDKNNKVIKVIKKSDYDYVYGIVYAKENKTPLFLIGSEKYDINGNPSNLIIEEEE